MAEERAIPFSLEAEEAVVGSILIDGEAINQIIDNLKPEDFFSERNGIIYKAMAEIRARGDAVNQITVGAELTRLAGSGGESGASIAYLSHLISICPTSMDIEHYAEIVRRLSFDRQLIMVAAKISNVAFAQDPDINRSLDNADGILQELRQKMTIRSRRLILGKPRLIETNPPRYIWNVNGEDLRLTLGEITVWGRFKNRVISELNFVPIKPKDWDDTINDLITHSLPIEAPYDASEEQQLKITIHRWFERMREANVYSDLSVGRHVIKEVKGASYYFFKSTPLLDYLKKEHKKGLNSEDLWVSVHKWKGIKHKIRVKTPTGTMPVDLWGLPIDFAEEEEKEAVPDWF